MSVYYKIKSRVQNIKDKTRGHHKWKMFLYAGIVVTLLFTVWLTSTNRGWIMRSSFAKTFAKDTERIVTVYSADGSKIREFKGTYNVEFFADDYLVVMNQQTGERINLYGASTIVVDEAPDNVHLPQQRKRSMFNEQLWIYR